MSTTPSSPQGRREILEAFRKLPQQQQELLFRVFQQQNCLMVLWGFGEFPSGHMPAAEERRHLLLAYKALCWIWFDRLPKKPDEVFPIYVCDRVPLGQGPDDVDQTFAASAEQLKVTCSKLRKPGWASAKATRVSVSLYSFPYEAGK